MESFSYEKTWKYERQKTKNSDAGGSFIFSLDFNFPPLGNLFKQVTEFLIGCGNLEIQYF